MVPAVRILRLRPHHTCQRHLGACTRKYHSYHHPPPPGPFTSIETAILSAATAHIPSHGFTHAALALGAKDIGYLDVSTNLFPRGPFSLVHYHLVTKRLGLAQHQGTSTLHDSNNKPLGIGAKVKVLTWTRLKENRDIIHRWQEALALMAMPSNVSISLQELALLADEIWFLSGDTSVDFTWYTKRATLSSIYAATELYMTTDKSIGFSDTSNFMDRRFKDSQLLGTAIGSLGQWVGFTASAGINVLRSKGVRI